ncbi:MAG: glutamine--tRNA ligase, partial [Clostridia bacterium]|nr:glutamine--tRNA ligase [Clostridia bacterium]
LHIAHHQTGDKWCIYPMYDFAHPIQDAIEGVTHSLCSLEYEAHRPLYDWVVNACGFEQKPRQIEFARLNLTNTIMSKRYLRRLVEEHFVSGWDDPRMPTLCAMRRRGYPAAAVRDFLARIGVAKADSVVDTAILEHCVRENLNANALRRMAITEPLKLVIDNWEPGRFETVEVENNPNDPDAGTHPLRFGRELWIEQSDFMAEPVKKFFRLKPDGEVRLKGAYIVKCVSWKTEPDGTVSEVHVTYDPETKSGECERKVKGTLHWVAAADAIPAEFRHYGSLMREAAEGEEIADFTALLDPHSLEVKQGFIEPALEDAKVGEAFQFVRMGYYAKDPDSTPAHPVFNRVVGLKDSFKIQ